MNISRSLSLPIITQSFAHAARLANHFISSAFEALKHLAQEFTSICKSLYNRVFRKLKNENEALFDQLGLGNDILGRIFDFTDTRIANVCKGFAEASHHIQTQNWNVLKNQLNASPDPFLADLVKEAEKSCPTNASARMGYLFRVFEKAILRFHKQETFLKEVQQETLSTLERVNKIHQRAKDFHFVRFWQQATIHTPLGRINLIGSLGGLNTDLKIEEQAIALKEPMKRFPNILASIIKLEFSSVIPTWELPAEITLCTQLRELTINCSWIKEIPSFLCELRHLQVLNLTSNRICEIPEWMSQLPSLQTLDLSSNELTDIPESLRSLATLQQLRLEENCIRDVEKVRRLFGHLQVLSIDNQHPNRKNDRTRLGFYLALFEPGELTEESKVGEL